jgi:hypothetical protein
VDALGSEGMGPDQIDERHQRCRCRAYPVGERRNIEFDAFVMADLALSIERQVQAVQVSGVMMSGGALTGVLDEREG